jgi:hypothetical protein
MAVFETSGRVVSVPAQAAAIATKGLLLVASALLLVGCEEEQVEVMENIRAIKTITVADLGSGQLRRFPGVVEAVDTSSVSFEVGGNGRDAVSAQRGGGGGRTGQG